MGRPSGIQVIDTMMGLPGGDRRWWTRSMAPLLLDAESQRDLDHAAGYMYKDLPDSDPADDPVETLLGQMDAFGIDIGMIPVSFEDEPSRRAIAEHGNRLVGSFAVDPNRGMEAVRSLRRAVDELGVVAASFFPCGCVPQVPINDKRAYPVYACCVDLDIPIFINAGVPGPRVPMGAQKVGRVDEVCWFFPDLRIVLRHGCEPWEKLAVKLMVKWPNLYYSTSAFAPRYYPKAIINYANTRGADRVLYAGYYPSGLTLERSFSELEDVPFRDAVWPKFLRENALGLLKLDGRHQRTAAPEPAGA
jgi:predicted TIM-barrel fold metal-dependent hydrolase